MFSSASRAATLRMWLQHKKEFPSSESIPRNYALIILCRIHEAANISAVLFGKEVKSKNASIILKTY